MLISYLHEIKSFDCIAKIEIDLVVYEDIRHQPGVYVKPAYNQIEHVTASTVESKSFEILVCSTLKVAHFPANCSLKWGHFYLDLTCN